MEMKELLNILRGWMRGKGVFFVLFVMYLLWMLPGVFPLCSYEGDALSIVWGCEQALRSDVPFWELDSYGYWMQPLIYYTICFVGRIMPWASCEAIYMGLTAVFAIAMICLILAFAHKLSGIGLTKLLVALYLLPEAAALAFYPNSAVFVLVFFIGGLLLTLYRRVWVACVLFCLAPLFRLDILYMYPLIVLLNVYVLGWNRKSIIVSLADALSVSVVTFAGYYLLHANIMYTLSEFGRWSDMINMLDNVKAMLGFYTILNLFLIPIGLYLLYRNNRKKLFWMVIAALVIIHLVNIDFGNASKHYCYLLPFVVIAIGASIDKLSSLYDKRKWLFVSLTGVIVLFNIVSVSFVLPTDFPKEYDSLKRFRPGTDLIDLRIFNHEVGIGIGGGADYSTRDEIMLMTGNFFYPRFIHNIKERDYRKACDLESFVMRNDEDFAVFWPRYEDNMRINNILARQGRESSVDVVPLCGVEIDVRSHIPEVLEIFRSNLADYSSGHEGCEVYVLSPTTIGFKIEGLLHILEQEGLLENVEGSGVLKYCRGNNAVFSHDNCLKQGSIVR